jgi:lipopolysaccharide/colanic/teichoic acid biosynthesis glycosyltransferase
LLARDAFARLVLCERRRFERGGRPFGLLVLRAPAPPERLASPLGETARAAVMTAMRETDVAGWITEPSTLGILLPDLPASGPWAAVERMRARVERALARHRLAGHRVTVTSRLFPEPAAVGSGATPEAAWTSPDDTRAVLDRLLYPERGEQGPARRRAQMLKRGLDLSGSLALLVACAPVWLLIAALVRLSSPGPVLFRQERVGFLGRRFTMLKFRTMYTGVDEAVHREFVGRFIADDLPSTSAALFKLANDPRITPLGRLLRKTSLDELPQLWNVVRGEMSLVGPRPPLPYELERYAPWHHRRVLEARPGLTGLWQVRGRSRTTFDEMVRLDLRYVRTRSLGTDLRILLATPRAVISGKGAC